eukprot:scaffold188477_cov14-Tisochrysis_lutea.AAC.1
MADLLRLSSWSTIFLLDCSYPMRRMFVRGLMRQLGSPALLAASYSGNSGAVANAAVCELEPAL